MIHRTAPSRRVAPASTTTTRTRTTANRRPPSASRRRPSASPSAIRHRHRLTTAAVISAVLIAAAVFHILSTHGNTTVNVIAIQPRPGSPATVNADVTAELAQAAANGGQLLVAEIVGNATAAPALYIPLSCAPGTNTLICEQSTTRATRAAARVTQRLVNSRGRS